MDNMKRICDEQKILLDAVNMADQSYSIVHDLGVLFKAIRDLSDEFSQARGLASVGMYLAEDWSNQIDCEREVLEKKRNAA